MTVPIVVVSDTHVNSRFGLWPANFVMKEGDQHLLNPYQRWLLEKWNDFTSLVPKGCILVLNGDLVQGVHPTREIDIITPSALDMRRAAVRLLSPLVDKAKEVHVMRGTPWHGGVGEQDTESIAEDLGAVEDEETGQFTKWELWYEHDGKLFHFTHHIGIAPIYPLTPMAREMTLAKVNAVDLGMPMPDCMVRSHRHVFKVYLDGGRMLVVTPAWQLRTDFLWQRNPQSLPSIGGLFLGVERGRIQHHPVIYDLPKPKILKGRG